MSLNRIQKLLFSEYSDFEDMVLVESPFAETTREGRGIRQVQIGLTPTKLVLATDIIKNVSDYPIAFFPGCVDAEIECLELISIFPIELVTLSVFRRRRRKVLKAKFHDGNPNHSCKIVYFELGGSDKRKMFWNLWCERVRFLSPEEKESPSVTEVSVASSTSTGSVRVARTRVSDDKIWQYYDGADRISPAPVQKGSLRWTDKDLFFGDKMETISYKVDPTSFSSLIQNDTDEVRTLYRRQRFQASRSSFSSVQSKECSHSRGRRAELINRFGEGIDEGCHTNLYMTTVSSDKRCLSVQSADSVLVKPQKKHSPLEFKKLCDEAIRIWEKSVGGSKNEQSKGHCLMTMSDLHYCFGIYFLGRGDTYSAQIKKTTSVICLKDENTTEEEFDKPSSKFHLCNSPSHEAVRRWSDQHIVEQQPLHFWTTNCWYRQRSIKKIYKGNLNLIRKVRSYSKSHSNSALSSKKSRLVYFGKLLLKNPKTIRDCADDSVEEYKRRLKMENAANIWDVESSSMACQLTAIDAQLFLMIPPGELRLLLIQKNGKSSINLMTWLVFSHRITCLVATQIVGTEDIESRARLISRFISAAEKCHFLQNFQSCRSLLNGLQCPAVYRLKKTWSRVKLFHAKNYQAFVKLSRLYRDPRLPVYRKAFHKSRLKPPYLPSAMYILSTLLGRNIERPARAATSVSSLSQVSEPETSEGATAEHRCKVTHKSSMPKTLKQILSALKINPGGKSCGVAKAEDRLNPALSRYTLHPLDIQLGDVALNRLSEQSETGSDLEIAEAILRNGQRAARKYNLGENDQARDFLLKTPYKESRVNYFESFRIEPD